MKKKFIIILLLMTIMPTQAGASIMADYEIEDGLWTIETIVDDGSGSHYNDTTNNNIMDPTTNDVMVITKKFMLLKMPEKDLDHMFRRGYEWRKSDNTNTFLQAMQIGMDNNQPHMRFQSYQHDGGDNAYGDWTDIEMGEIYYWTMTIAILGSNVGINHFLDKYTNGVRTRIYSPSPMLFDKTSTSLSEWYKFRMESYTNFTAMWTGSTISIAYGQSILQVFSSTTPFYPLPLLYATGLHDNTRTLGVFKLLSWLSNVTTNSIQASDTLDMLINLIDFDAPVENEVSVTTRAGGTVTNSSLGTANFTTNIVKPNPISDFDLSVYKDNLDDAIGARTFDSLPSSTKTSVAQLTGSGITKDADLQAPKIPGFQKLSDGITQLVNNMRDEITDIGDSIDSNTMKNINKLIDGFNDVAGMMEDRFTMVYNQSKDIANGMHDDMMGGMHNILSALEDFGDQLNSESIIEASVDKIVSYMVSSPGVVMSNALIDAITERIMTRFTDNTFTEIGLGLLTPSLLGLIV